MLRKMTTVRHRFLIDVSMSATRKCFVLVGPRLMARQCGKATGLSRNDVGDWHNATGVGQPSPIPTLKGNTRQCAGIPIHCRHARAYAGLNDHPLLKGGHRSDRQVMAGNWVKLPNGSATDTVRPLPPKLGSRTAPRPGRGRTVS